MPQGVRTGQDFRGQGTMFQMGTLRLSVGSGIEGSSLFSDSDLSTCHVQSSRKGRRSG